MTAMIYVVKHRETISSVSSSTGFTSTYIPPTSPNVIYALVQAVAGTVRYCIDGSTPSTSLGLRLTEDSTMEVWGGEALRDFRAIDDGGTATLEVIYFGGG